MTAGRKPRDMVMIPHDSVLQSDMLIFPKPTATRKRNRIGKKTGRKTINTE
jgi:hypothetical protein